MNITAQTVPDNFLCDNCTEKEKKKAKKEKKQPKTTNITLKQPAFGRKHVLPLPLSNQDTNPHIGHPLMRNLYFILAFLIRKKVEIVLANPLSHFEEEYCCFCHDFSVIQDYRWLLFNLL
jgi:hypothetical protein